MQGKVIVTKNLMVYATKSRYLVQVISLVLTIAVILYFTLLYSTNRLLDDVDPEGHACKP